MFAPISESLPLLKTDEELEFTDRDIRQIPTQTPGPRC